MSKKEKSYIQKYFEANLLDGNDINNCGGAKINMVCAKDILEVVLEAINSPEHLEEMKDRFELDELEVINIFLDMAEKQRLEAIKRTEKDGFNWSTEGWSITHEDIAKALSNKLPELLKVKGGEG